MTAWHERWNIKHLSPSSLNAWRDSPAFFAAQYCFGLRQTQEAMPAAWRGAATETALASFLHGSSEEEALERALRQFELEAQGLADDATEKQRGLLPRFCEQTIAAAKEYQISRPNATQLRVEYMISGIEIPVIGYADFCFDHHTLDLKTTERMPSSPSLSHAMQASLYGTARQESETKLLYVTPAKHALYSIDEEQMRGHMRDLERIARAIRATLSKAQSKNELAEMLAPDFGHYRWSDPNLVNRVQHEIQAWS